MLPSTMAPKTLKTNARKAALDAERMSDLAAWTARSLETEHPVPFGSDVFHSKTGEVEAVLE